MLSAQDRYSPRRRRIAVAIASVIVLTAALGIYLAVARPTPQAEVAPVPASPSAPGAENLKPEPAGEAQPTSLTQLEPTPNPEAFAESVAHALFDWDTRLAIPLSEYSGRLVAVADPTGQESPGLVADIAGYLPTAQAWAFLQPYYTRQWIEIDSISVPESWPQALAEAGPNGLAPGTTAYTVRGTRHRAGVWEAEPVGSEHEVAFTVFIVCEPTYPTCHLLRLSRLDEPLE